MDKFAMVFAAGKGTRLGGISQHTPKALIQINGKPMLWHILNKLRTHGFNNIVVNVHHLAQNIIEFVEKTPFPELTISISHENDFLADTGGGLKLASPFFQSANHILLHNVDVVSDISLHALYEYHISNNNLATLAVKNRTSGRYLMFDKNLFMKGWQNTTTGEQIVCSQQQLTPFAFSGIHVVSAEILNLFPQIPVFSMTKLYLDLCQNHSISGFIHNDDEWIDVGRPEHFDEASLILNRIKHDDIH
jgi:N-acetyl-alpha-D-muramate 1-phosphate uridylyltransferase